MVFRGFVAAEVGPLEPIVDLQRSLEATGADLNLVDPDLLHVTLKFLGDVPEDRVDAVEAVLQDAVEGVAPQDLELRGVGAFPSLDYLRVIWVGVADPGPLTQVAHRLDGGLEPLGFEPEDRAYHAHVTVARVRSGRAKDRLRNVVEANATTPFGRVAWDQVVLKRSELGPRGPTYHAVRSVPLEA